jgi:aryl-alcohol dehydrogenase-like predicted oxidoreductase
LRRLGVERIDLLQFHWWDYQAPGTLRVCERLHLAQQRGKIHLLGLTNFSTGQAQNVIDDGTPIASIQTQYSLLDRRPQRQLAAYCAKREIGLLTYGVLAGGFLVDRYLDAAAPRSMNRSLQKYRLIIDEVGGWPVLQALLNVLGATAKRLDTSIAAVATRWVLDQTAVAAVILGTGSCSRAAEHRRLQDLQLDEQARQELGALLADQPVPPGDVYELERDPHGMHARVIKTELRAGDA